MNFPTFSTEITSIKTETVVGDNRAESTNEWTAACGSTSKIPPAYDGTTTWFKHEELIEDWLDLTVREVSKRGPALKMLKMVQLLNETA